MQSSSNQLSQFTFSRTNSTAPGSVNIQHTHTRPGGDGLANIFGRRQGLPRQISGEQTADICTEQILPRYWANIPVYSTQFQKISLELDKNNSLQCFHFRRDIDVNLEANAAFCWSAENLFAGSNPVVPPV